MRTLFGWFGSLLLLACLAAPAVADGMRPLNGGRSPFMFAPAPPLLRFHGPMIGHERPLIPRRVLRGQALTRQFATVNPGPVPPFSGTIVPPFILGAPINSSIVVIGNRLFIGSNGFLFDISSRDFIRGRLNSFFGNGFTGGSGGQSNFIVGATDRFAVPAPVPVVTTSPVKAQIIVLNPSPAADKVRIFSPTNAPQGSGNPPGPRIAEIPAQ